MIGSIQDNGLLFPLGFSDNSAQHFWLSSLETCGVDLYEYGKREEELHERGLVRNEIKFSWWTGRVATAKLASFTYGSSPGEWSIKMEREILDPDQDSDQDSDQVEEMPGGWIED